jgi:N4-gp56 family major capsid protein
MVRYRQFCDAREAFGLGKGETFNWNVFSDVATQGGSLTETEQMPETNFTISQASLTVTEYGNSVPFTKKLDDLSEQPITEILHKVLKNDARKALDSAARTQFTATVLKATANTATTFALNTASTPAANHSNEYANEATLSHAKSMSDTLVERNIPTYDGSNYVCISRPTNIRFMKNFLEDIHQYTSEGWHTIMNGEKGRYEGIRYVEQTGIAATSSTLSDDMFFFGADTVVEAFAIPEEIRGKIPTDYGRSRGIAWYALLGYGLVHTVAAQARIIHWTDAAA